MSGRACCDGGLDNISNVSSALGGGGNGNGARLSISSRRAAVVVRARNESSTSGESTRCRSSSQSSSGLGGGVDRGKADGRLQAGGDAGDLVGRVIKTHHVEVVASGLIRGTANVAQIQSYTTIVAAVRVLLVANVGGGAVRSAEFGLASAVQGLVVDKAGNKASKASIVDALALG